MTNRVIWEELNIAAGFTIKDTHICLPVTNDNTNVAYRIATFLHILSGSNDLDFLSRYSEHIVEFSDNQEQLRGAYGPRMRNWIGAHQLQEMINLNADISIEPVENIEENVVDIDEDGMNVLALPGSQYVKPAGIDQTMAVFDDLKHGMDETCIIVRDPGTDFEESDDIPDLISIVFVNDLGGAFDTDSKRGTLNVTAQYGVGNNDNFVNEVWAISLLVQMYVKHLNYSGSRFVILCNGWNEDNHSDLENNISDYKGIGICAEAVQSFWEDLDKLQTFAHKIPSYLNESTFENPDVSNDWCVEKLKEFFIDKIESPFMKDMAFGLAIWAFWTYGTAKPTYAGPYEDKVFDLLSWMHPTSIRLETAEFLSHENLPYKLGNLVDGILKTSE